MHDSIYNQSDSIYYHCKAVHESRCDHIDAIYYRKDFMYTWLTWLKNWRTIADESDPMSYIPIEITQDGKEYEVLRVSKFSTTSDADKPCVKTSIREFNEKTALHSRATRDLGVVRVITNKLKPMFLIEPGADTIEWMAMTQGVPVNDLVKVMRAGDLGRRVRRLDRKALKNSREETDAAYVELQREREKMQKAIDAIEAELTNTKRARDRMRDTLIEQNEEQLKNNPRTPVPASGTRASPLGTAQDKGTKITSTRPLPGSFES